MDTESEPAAAGLADAQAPGSRIPASNEATAESVAYETCLLLMARAAECAGLYGAAHPSTRVAVEQWFRHLSPILRMHGTFTLSAEGQIASINGVALTVTNPAILSMLRRLYTTRAGRLEMLSGLDVETAGRLTAFLADADPTHVAGEDRSLDAWLARSQLRHVRVTPIRLCEVRDGDRIVASEPIRPASRATTPGAAESAPPAPTQVAAWARQFRREADRSGPSGPLPRDVRDLIAACLRGTASTLPADLPEHMARAARHAPELAGLVLKCALVAHELTAKPGTPLGHHVVNGLRTVLDALRRTAAAQAPEGWHDTARTLAALEGGVLEKLQAVAGGTEADAEVIRSGVLAMQRDLEGAALQREYEQKRNELQAVERKMGRLINGDPTTR